MPQLIFFRLIIVFSLLFIHSASYSYFNSAKNKYIIMLDPSGDAKNPGRSIGNSFERGFTLKIAELIERSLRSEYPNLHIVLSRKPGQLTDQLEIAQFSNRIGTNLYLSIHCYQSESQLPSLALYHLMWNRTTDLWQVAPQQPTLLPAQLAYCTSLKTTMTFLNRISESLAQANSETFNFVGAFSLPFRPFYGILAPAIAFECGLRSEKDISLVISPIRNALISLLNKELHYE